jgi:hypothetical protein
MAIVSLKNKTKSRSVLAGNTPEIAMFESIQTVTVGAGGQASITFSSIPNTYKHLQIRGTARDNRASTWIDTMYMYFNADSTGSNYYYHVLGGNSSSAFASASAGQTGYGAPIGLTGASNVTTSFGPNVIDILDYANTNKNKTVRSLVGVEDNANGSIRLTSGLWLSTAAITSITLVNDGAGVPANSFFQQHSTFTLYGIK